MYSWQSREQEYKGQGVYKGYACSLGAQKMKQIRPYGRGRVALHLPADHPLLAELRRQCLFEAVYRQKGQGVIAYDLAFPADQAARLRRELSENEL